MNKDKHIIVWEGQDAKSLECLSWQLLEESILISSHLTGTTGGIPFAIHYRIETDHQWNVTGVLVNDLLNTRNNIRLKADGKGKWRRGNETLALADGCIDVDLTLTPFTNTLPVRRLSWQTGQRQTIQAVYILLPELTLSRSEQHYTKLDAKTFLFETGEHFSAKLSLDENGMVISYPGIANRIFPGK